MSRSLAWVLGALLASSVPATAAPADCGQQSGAQKADPGAQRGATPPDNHDRQPARLWWKVPESRAELGITDQQSKEIDDIFQSTRPLLNAAKDELDKLDETVSKMMKDGTADIESVRRQVVLLEQSRAKLNQTRTMMLYRMHRVLSPEQRVKLTAMFQRWEAERRKMDSPKDRR
jgi:Spy/CpxP family protein refolding chaperone